MRSSVKCQVSVAIRFGFVVGVTGVIAVAMVRIIAVVAVVGIVVVATGRRRWWRVDRRRFAAGTSGWGRFTGLSFS
jgi:hypothetical protein